MELKPGQVFYIANIKHHIVELLEKEKPQQLFIKIILGKNSAGIIRLKNMEFLKL